MNNTEIAARLIMARVEAYLSDNRMEGILSASPVLRTAAAELTDDALKKWATESVSLESDDRYAAALRIMGRDTVLQTVLDLCVAVFLWPEFEDCLNDRFGFGPCLHTAALLEGRKGLQYGQIQDYFRRLCRIMQPDPGTEPLQYTRIRADERLLGFLSGFDEINRRLAGITVYFGPEDEGTGEAFANEDIIEKGAAYFADGGGVLALTGKGGRRFIARHIAKKTGRGFLSLNIRDLIRRAEREEMSSLCDLLIREAYYLDAGICLYGFDNTFITGGISDRQRGRRDMEALCGLLFAPFMAERIPLILCVDDEYMLPGRDMLPGLCVQALPAVFSFDERKKLWQGLFDANDLKFDASSFASRYRLNPREAAMAVLEYMEQGKKEAGEESFSRLAVSGSGSRDTSPGRIIFPDVRLEDVKLKDSVKNVLKDTVNAVLSGPVVLEEWGLERKYPYGRGVSLLMAGPPGTGKTMSANAIAGELSLPLYQVNLSDTVDKYIGETEKNLEKAFSFAEKNNAILFFDEADALFGARSEVHDSKDRYANTEISYLLQRMESFDGIVIMATNIKGNIDPAFMRRIRFVAHFENPDEELRRIIWEGCLTEKVPCEDIDIDYLASQFDTFTGSMIKTVFLNACVKAAGEGEKLSMKHLLYAVRQEKEKESPVGFSADLLGKYAYLI